MNIIVQIKIPEEIIKQHQEKFEALEEMSMKAIAQKLVEDEFDISLLDPKYYNDHDINEIFFKKSN